MIILTKNRIIEKGDEFRHTDGRWIPVPDKNVGLQVLFSEYKEVRRPREEPKNGSTAVIVVNEKITRDVSETNRKLPTVISKKAHENADNGNITMMPATKVVVPALHNEKKISFVDRYPLPIWIGRNGTYYNRGLMLYHRTGSHEGIIKMVPVGLRGEARNALIEFPVEVIPDVIEFLQRHQPTTTGGK